MAHFYASVSGSRDGIATKTGTKKSGMLAHIRGWNIGVKVYIHHVDGKDIVYIYKTRGSGSAETYSLATITEGD